MGHSIEEHLGWAFEREIPRNDTMAFGQHLGCWQAGIDWDEKCI